MFAYFYIISHFHSYFAGRAHILFHAPDLIAELTTFRTACPAGNYLACGTALGKFIGIFAMNPPEDPAPGMDTLPAQVHISVGGVDPATGSPSGVYIAWFTQDPAPSEVHYGSGPANSCLLLLLLLLVARCSPVARP